ncbi:MAG: hypothetical protein ABIF11_02080 [Nitrospirota bacterium]
MALLQRVEEYEYLYPSKRTILNKLLQDTEKMVNCNILNLFEMDKTGEVSLKEVRNRLSKIKKPLSQEIFEGRENL